MGHPITRCTAALTIAAAVSVSYGQLVAQEGFRFRSGVELVNVTVTVTDHSGRSSLASSSPTSSSMTMTSLSTSHTSVPTVCQ